ncbi:hypothetical protein PybrP1_005454 [[Pythium] brassicae (nom. inval.)]|nr:hypothetical protein PybrP1_005454 [[Pythium] brassicae (nom. inval.)]
MTSTAESEWVALQRRYHAQLLSADAAVAESISKRAHLFMCLTDPDLPPAFSGETELHLELPHAYPACEPVFDLTGFRSRLTTAQFRAIDAGLKTRALELRGTLSLRKLLTWLDNNFYPLMMAAAENESSSSAEAAGERETPTEAAARAVDAPVAITSTEAAAVVAVAAQTSGDAKKKKPRKKKDSSRTLCRFFLRQACKSGDECKFSHELRATEPKKAPSVSSETTGEQDASTLPALPDTIQDASPTLKSSQPKAPKKKEGEVSAPSPVEDASKKPKKAKKPARPRVCKFFAIDSCRAGERCKFLHEVRSKGAKADAPLPQQPEKPKGIVIKVLKASSPPVESAERAVVSSSRDSVSVTTGASPPASVASEDWTEEQQKALDKALKKYPATFDKKIRWLSIASEVDGKSLNECIDRFKLLCQMVRDEQPAVTVGESVQNVAAHDADNSDDSRAADKRIIPAEARASIETEPEQTGAQVRLDELFLHQVGTLVPHRLVCQVQCANCPLRLDAVLALDAPSIRKWCPRCSVLHLVHLRPVFAHASSAVVAYVDTNENCSVVDVVPSELLATCLECGSEVLFPGVTPTRRSEHACFSCHTKLALMAKRYVVGQFATEGGKAKKQSSLSPSSSAPSGSPTSTKPGAPKRLVENFVLGQPLPNKGACEHYRHSLRWFRFQCCGKAFPCDVCHDRSECADANTGKIASRMICGLCSKEQSSAVKECACGNEVGRKKVTSSHWEGGHGCRDPNRMSPTDKKKYRGLNKTGSKKQNRVGVAAKQTRRGDERTSE